MQQHAMCNNELKSHNGISVSVFVFSIETLRSALLYWSMIGLRCYWSALLLPALLLYALLLSALLLSPLRCYCPRCYCPRCYCPLCAATVRAATVRAAAVRAATVPFALLLGTSVLAHFAKHTDI